MTSAGRLAVVCLLLGLIGIAVPRTLHASGAAVPEVTALSFSGTGGGGVLDIRMSAPLAFTFLALDAPRRLVFDFPPLEWTLSAPAVDGDSAVAGIRFGAHPEGGARLVLDLAAPLRVRKTELLERDDHTLLRAILEPMPAAAFAARTARRQAVPPRDPEPAAADKAPGDIVVAIDPGHGGVDAGARQGAMIEKAIALTFARRLAQRINQEPGFAAFLTRERDVFVRLENRVRLAREGGAHLLISIHADNLEDDRASGIAVYTLSDEGSEDAEVSLTVREERTGILGGMDLGGDGDDLAKVLIDLAQRGTMPEGDKLAAALISELEGDFKLLLTRPHRKAGYRVLKAPDIPSVLVEIGFLSNEADRKRLRSHAWQRRAADTLTMGLKNWAKTASPGFLEVKQ